MILTPSERIVKFYAQSLTATCIIIHILLHTHVVGSLTDGSTETFWESHDEPRGRARTLTLTFNKECQVFAVAVHIDNQKDSGVRIVAKSLTSTCI